jgi:conjugal transfer/entry exclusion protein
MEVPMKPIGLVVVLVTFLWWAPETFGAFGVGDIVFDPTNLEQNLEAAIRLLDLRNLKLQDLALLDDLRNHQDLINAARRLALALAPIAQRLAGRHGLWLALMAQFPCTTEDLISWNKAYDQESMTSADDALQAQTLLQDTTPSLESLSRLIEQALRTQGSVQGLQSLSGILGQILQAKSILTAGSATFHEMVTRKESKKLMNVKVMEWLGHRKLDGLYGRPRPPCPGEL